MKKMLLVFVAAMVLFFAAGVPAEAAAQEDGKVLAQVEATGSELLNEAEEAEDAADNTVSIKAIAAGALILVVASVGALAMSKAISSGSENIARQPSAAGNIRTNVMLGLVFIETAIIYALIIAILIIFVL